MVHPTWQANNATTPVLVKDVYELRMPVPHSEASWDIHYGIMSLLDSQRVLSQRHIPWILMISGVLPVPAAQWPSLEGICLHVLYAVVWVQGLMLVTASPNLMLSLGPFPRYWCKSVIWLFYLWDIQTHSVMGNPPQALHINSELSMWIASQVHELEFVFYPQNGQGLLPPTQSGG